MKIHLKKTLTGFDPSDDDARKYHNKFDLGDIYHMNVSKFKDQRTVELNGLYWSVLRVAVDNQNNFITDKQLHIRIKMVLGIVEQVYNPLTLSMDELPGSTAFDKMDNELFKAYFKDSMEFIKKYVLPGVTEYELIEAACKRTNLRSENREWIKENFK